MVVDGSALVAMMLGESEASALVDRLEAASTCTTHPVAVYEATAAIAQVTGQSVLASYQSVAEFLSAAEIELASLGQPEMIAAIEAFSRYGKGQGHSASLNMGDCFSYGCAQVRGMPLLAKDEDFAGTDLA